MPKIAVNTRTYASAVMIKPSIRAGSGRLKSLEAGTNFHQPNFLLSESENHRELLEFNQHINKSPVLPVSIVQGKFGLVHISILLNCTQSLLDMLLG